MRRSLWSVSMLMVCSFGCTYSGAGRGIVTSPGTVQGSLGPAKGQATFSWSARGAANEGTIAATLADGRSCRGSYLQMTSTSSYESYAPYWGLWSNPRWGYWGPGYYGPSRQFATHYHGKALAYLKRANGELRRCCFILRDPNRGVPGGAKGDCQLSTQEQIFEATLDPAR